MVLASSPVLLKGSTRKEPPSISPTFKLVPAFWLSLEYCVPPVVFSPLPLCEPLAVAWGSTEDSISGGALSEPTFGMSFVIDEVLFAKLGFNGFSVWNLRCSSTFSWWRSVRVEECKGLVERTWIERENAIILRDMIKN